MRSILIWTAIIALLGCDQAEDSNDTTAPHGMAPMSSSGNGGSTATDETDSATSRSPSSPSVKKKGAREELNKMLRQ